MSYRDSKVPIDQLRNSNMGRSSIGLQIEKASQSKILAPNKIILNEHSKHLQRLILNKNKAVQNSSLSPNGSKRNSPV